MTVDMRDVLSQGIWPQEKTTFLLFVPFISYLFLCFDLIWPLDLLNTQQCPPKVVEVPVALSNNIPILDLDLGPPGKSQFRRRYSILCCSGILSTRTARGHTASLLKLNKLASKSVGKTPM